MRLVSVLTLLMGIVLTGAAFGQSLDDLARKAEEAATTEAVINQEREGRFVRERDEQDRLLQEAPDGTGE